MPILLSHFPLDCYTWLKHGPIGFYYDRRVEFLLKNTAFNIAYQKITTANMYNDMVYSEKYT